jgi:competence protein ComFB
MDIHNTNEEMVFGVIQNILKEIRREGNRENLCLCYQCQMDTICYALNRIEPHYIVSNRGLTRIEQSGITYQQIEADITTLLYKGLRLVNHNRRPTSSHDDAAPGSAHSRAVHPVYDIPTISGRIFDGISFAPIVDIELSLYCEGDLVPMRNPNWQNPYFMVSSTPGVFSFWPAPVTADAPDTVHDFKYSIKVNSPDHEPMSHFFSIKSTSKYHTPQSYTLNRTFKLPDLYLFPPGEAEQNG